MDDDAEDPDKDESGFSSEGEHSMSPVDDSDDEHSRPPQRKKRARHVQSQGTNPPLSVRSSSSGSLSQSSQMSRRGHSPLTQSKKSAVVISTSDDDTSSVEFVNAPNVRSPASVTSVKSSASRSKSSKASKKRGKKAKVRASPLKLKPLQCECCAYEKEYACELSL